MIEISDAYMAEMLQKARPYTVVLLKAGPKRWDPEAKAIVREHGRRNFAMRAAGVLSIVCPISDDGEWRGVGIFNAGVEEVTRLMDDDPGVQAGVFTFEVHPARGFPGDSLP